MSQQVIERIGSLGREESLDVNRVVLKGIVPAAQRTFAVITPNRRIGFSKMFFSRQQTLDADAPERWSILGRFTWWLCGVYFTNRGRGEMLITHLTSVIGWLRESSEQERVVIVRRDFWQIDEDTACLRAARHSAKASGDERRVLELTSQIAANERDILELQRATVYAGATGCGGSI
jgi:hypothetical protein